MAAPLRITVRRSDPPVAPDRPVEVDLAMPSDVGEVEAAVELIARHCFAGVSPCSRTVFRLRVTLAEALSNAILRGNGADPRKNVWIRAELHPDAIRLSVRDEGGGLADALRADPCLPEEIEEDRGRGLFIIKHLADRVEFNDLGNTIWMTLPRC
ncbi:MAG: ATP-binding protein [Gemmatimonadales bacterium]